LRCGPPVSGAEDDTGPTYRRHPFTCLPSVAVSSSTRAIKRPVAAERRFSSPHLRLLQSLPCAVKLSEVITVEIAELGAASSLSLVSESPPASHDSCAVPLLTSPFSSLTCRTVTPVTSCCRRSRRCSVACACRQQLWPL
jgi:hypothetical protein